MVQVLELTIPFGTTMANAAERKETRYEELIQSAQQAGYATTLITVQVGAQRCTTHDWVKDPQARAETLVKWFLIPAQPSVMKSS